MFDENFGKYLSEEEKNFINEYCNLISKYGSSSFFPIPEQLKMEQYNKLMKVVCHLTDEERVKFNEFIDKAQTLHIGDNLETTGRTR